MKWLNGYRMRLVLIGFVAAMVFSGGSAKADFTFGEPTNLGPTVNSSARDGRTTISSDGLELYFDSERAGGLGDIDVYVTTRSTPDDPWGEPVNLGPTVNTSVREAAPTLSPDDLSLFFGSPRSGGSGGADLHVATRSTKNAAWGAPVNLGPTVNSSANDGAPSISADGLELFFQSIRSGGVGNADLYVTTRPTIHDDWRAPVNLGATVNTSAYDWGPTISSDRLMLLFYSPRPGGFGSNDIYMTGRPTIDSDWGEPVNLGPIINGSSADNSPTFSADGSMLYFTSDRPGGSGERDIWQAPIVSVVDFNGDGIVDAADMCIMVDHWGENYSMCDIGPMPWGDGIVDVQDLIVLAEHLFEDYRLIAHWKFDETEGATAYDIARGNDGFLFNDPVWLPAEGKKNGALQFDGIDDYVVSVNVLNPANGPFSVIAWIKGGAPGEVIISQTDGTGSGEIWLGMDAVSGCLMTGLVPPPVGRFIPQPLGSQVIITDSLWHHVGFVWDGLYRSLYVDGTEVATDAAALAPLNFSDGGLYFGTSKTLDEGTFFSGLIDDVRIYDVSLSADEIAALAR